MIPGPRVVQVPIIERNRNDYTALQLRCNAMNSSITNIMFTCKNAFQIMQEACTSHYQKMVIRWPSLPGHGMLLRPQPFLFVDYDRDTMYVQLKDATRLSHPVWWHNGYLAEVKFLAVRNPMALEVWPNAVWCLRKIQSDCPKLQKLTLVTTHIRTEVEEYRAELKFINLSNDEDYCERYNFTLPPQHCRVPDALRTQHLIQSFGYILFLSAVGYESKSKIMWHLQHMKATQPLRWSSHWDNLSVETAFKAERKQGSDKWYLEYIGMDVTEEDSEYVDPTIDFHWHKEFIKSLPQDGNLLSCRAAAEYENNGVCDICGESRWVPGRKDAFWLGIMELHGPIQQICRTVVIGLCFVMGVYIFASGRE